MTEERQRANARRRHRDHMRRASESDISAEQELAMRRKARLCPLCGVKLTSKPNLPNSKHLDHIIPIAIGGTHTHGNVRIICADCNMRRPKDGGDFTGQVTLWAQGPVPVKRPRKRHPPRNTETCKNGLHPWIPANIALVGGRRRCRACYEAKIARQIARQVRPSKPPKFCQCKCGVVFQVNGKAFMCSACTEAAGRKAAELHSAGGVNWKQVAALVGYGSGEGARYAAERIGYKPEPKRAEPRPKAGLSCQDCGQPVEDARGKRRPTCRACTEVRAWRAVELQQGGATLRAIADELGYGSITSVTNLIGTVVTVSTRTQRRYWPVDR